MTEKSIRIMLFTTAYKPMIGGSEIAIQEITRRLGDIFFDILTPRFSIKYLASEREDNVSIKRIGWGKKIDKLFFPLSGFLKGLDLTNNFKYDFLQAYQASYGALACSLLKMFRPDIKFILTLQEGEDLDRQNILIRSIRRFIITRADIITGISNYLIDYAKNINPKAEFYLIPNGVDLNIFNPKLFNQKEKEDLKRELQIDLDSLVILTTSRLVFKNGLERVIEAMSQLKSRFSKIIFVIIGEGNLKAKLMSKIKRLGLDKNVLLLGSVSHERIPLYIYSSDLFIRTPRSEGMGISFIEAMAMEKPVLATPVGGIKDFIFDNKTGFFWYKDKENLSDKISYILDNKDLAKTVALNGFNLVKENFNWDFVANKFIQIYKK